MRLLLIRHGQTIDNVHGVLGAVVPGPGLTALGQRQAAAIPAALASEEIAAIYVSTMVRTQQTAAALAADRNLEPQVLDGLREITSGDLEGRSDEEATHLYMRTIFSWWQSLDGRIPGGEDGHEFYARFEQAVAGIASAHREETVAVVSHGAAMRAWASYASTNIDPEFSRSHPLENTAMIVLEGTPEEGWRTTSWGSEPVGGYQLDDETAPDPTSEALA
ncbi:histidine phosphatase family protein [Subtercola boreus]|uniref:Histidine phosphatase family protein n=1 Tax=Subtercola boreus TaxID=120213 RepID=A0A3E0WD42_9MICO|nr:histidine phosphatase family protein [Subtercola boreus]RFA22714.1 histidine phosphatase family protein [Subtercola boreus]RFA23069.1 histidine phosphatase family protein [Subtercola boreus]RFA28822.1 histidine phosphatase family protein [Subtercola boreus]